MKTKELLTSFNGVHFILLERIKLLLEFSCQMFENSDKVFSPNLIDQSSCKMGLVLVCVVRILHDDWSIRLGENRPARALKHLAAILFNALFDLARIRMMSALPKLYMFIKLIVDYCSLNFYSKLNI